MLCYLPKLSSFLKFFPFPWYFLPQTTHHVFAILSLKVTATHQQRQLRALTDWSRNHWKCFLGNKPLAIFTYRWNKIVSGVSNFQFCNLHWAQMSNLRLLFSDNNAAIADFALHCVFRKTPNTQGGQIWKVMKLNAMKLLPSQTKQIRLLHPSPLTLPGLACRVSLDWTKWRS